MRPPRKVGQGRRSQGSPVEAGGQVRVNLGPVLVCSCLGRTHRSTSRFTNWSMFMFQAIVLNLTTPPPAPTGVIIVLRFSCSFPDFWSFSSPSPYFFIFFFFYPIRDHINGFVPSWVFIPYPAQLAEGYCREVNRIGIFLGFFGRFGELGADQLVHQPLDLLIGDDLAIRGSHGFRPYITLLVGIKDGKGADLIFAGRFDRGRGQILSDR